MTFPFDKSGVLKTISKNLTKHLSELCFPLCFLFCVVRLIIVGYNGRALSTVQNLFKLA